MFNIGKIKACSKLLLGSKYSFASSLKTVLISGESTNPVSVKAVFDSSKQTHDLSNPLELLLYSLISCENTTLRAIAKEKKVNIGSMNFKKVEALYDTRGFFGFDPNNKFSKIELEIEIQTNASREKIQEIDELMKKRCPVYNMLNLAGVNINTNYTLK